MDQEPPRDPVAIEWLVGHWRGRATEETWLRVGDELVGVSVGKGGLFEVMGIDQRPGFLELLARPGGGAPVSFACVAGGPTSAEFTAPTHDFPQRIRYERRGARLRADVGQLSGSDDLVLTWKAEEPATFYELERADRAFAEAVAARGIDGWVEAFHPEGRMWSGDRQVGAPDLAQAMVPVLTAGDLAWTPTTSGHDPWDDDRGFTIGTWTWAGHDGTSDQGWYVTFWRRDPDRGWLVWYDVGASTR